MAELVGDNSSMGISSSDSRATAFGRPSAPLVELTTARSLRVRAALQQSLVRRMQAGHVPF